MSFLRRIITPALVSRVFRQEIIHRPIHCCVYQHVNITSKLVELYSNKTNYTTVRWKSKKRQYDSDDEELVLEDDSSLSKDSKVVKFSTTSMRTDVVLKSALSISRNKVEQMFYESKIRVNGKKILKKSASVRLGDEVDVIKMVSPKNPDHIYVSRVEILDVAAKEESIQVTARRFKHLLIENYENDPIKTSEEV
ncbi:mitochondrial transcription rescue factor 1 [Spodoptera frugiperda]|uniref:Mitochondrial transcription rescue factor 1 n=1 Tax=Spodoptera frugiperda TaxID=7108 RepID=A0A9R0D5M5_SPOFR|nr:mitochondrial transcription rescue factor 1 [Spodoptera frugiperda]